MRRWKMAGGLIGLFALVLSLIPGCMTQSPTLASGAGSPEGISLISQKVEPHFPQSISFELKARSSSTITKVELEYQVKQIRSAEVIVVVFPDFIPGKEIETTWTWDMRKAGLPPGAEVSYHWKLWDSAGNRLSTEFVSFKFNDERYKWNSLKKGKLSLKWYRGDEAFAQRLMSSAQATLKSLEKDIGAVLKRPAQVWIYAGAADLRGAMIFPQEWTGGVAFVKFGIVALGIPPEMLAWGQRALAHELTHLAIYQLTFNPYNPLPTWLDEGLAMHSEGELRSDLKVALERAVSRDKLFSVRSLCSVFPAATEEARLCYAESYSLVEFLLRRFGREKLLNLLLTFKEGATYDEALLKVYGFDLDGLDRLWRESLFSSEKSEIFRGIFEELFDTPTPKGVGFSGLSAVCVREHSGIGEPDFRAVSNRPRPRRYTPKTTGTPGPGFTHALATLAGITLTEHPGRLARGNYNGCRGRKASADSSQTFWNGLSRHSFCKVKSKDGRSAKKQKQAKI